MAKQDTVDPIGAEKRQDLVDKDTNVLELSVIIAAAAAAGKEEITVEVDGKKTTIKIKQHDADGRELLAE